MGVEQKLGRNRGTPRYTFEGGGERKKGRVDMKGSGLLNDKVKNILQKTEPSIANIPTKRKKTKGIPGKGGKERREKNVPEKGCETNLNLTLPKKPKKKQRCGAVHWMAEGRTEKKMRTPLY